MSTILIVEDQAAFRDNLAEALEDQGYSVVRAASAEDAARTLDAQPVDLFLLDVALPGMSGLDFLRSLRRSSAHLATPAFFLTAHARPEAMEEASKLGVGDFLVKSDISLRDLLEKIQQELATTGSSAEPIRSRTEARRNLRPALRRWKPALDRPQVRELFELSSGGGADLRSHLALDPTAAKWLRRNSHLPGIRDPSVALRLLVLRGVVDATMRSVQAGQDIRRLWRRALATGLLSAAFHAEGEFGSPAESFLAGVCSQVPWIFAIQALETDYAEVKAVAWEDGRSITANLAESFGVDEATLAMETLRSLELPERVWKAVVDVHGNAGASGLWVSGAGGQILSISIQLSILVEPAWHPCVEVRGVEASELPRAPSGSDLSRLVPEIRHRFSELLDSDVLPEARLEDATRMVPVSAADRRLVYAREPGSLVPDPLEGALALLGNVEFASTARELLAHEDCVRVAWAEPGSALWDRLRRSPRRTVVLHHLPLPRGLATGAHAHLQLPAPLAMVERAVRGRG